MGRYVKGDIVLVLFPFSDLSNRKKRPALVITEFDRGDALICQITTNGTIDGFKIEIQNADLQTGQLLKQSYVRPNRLFTVDTNIIEKKLGSFKQVKLDEIISKIVEIIS